MMGINKNQVVGKKKNKEKPPPIQRYTCIIWRGEAFPVKRSGLVERRGMSPLPVLNVKHVPEDAD